VESFTPVINPPQVAILGVGNVNPRVVDGAPGALFLPAVSLALAQLELTLAV